MAGFVKGDFHTPSQSAAFRRSVAERMAAYEDRIAERIRRKMEEHGEDPAKLAYELDLNPRTPERWINEGVTPRPRQFRALAEHWGVPVSDLKPDLEKEEQALADQLDRIEEKLDELLERAAPTAPDAEDVPDGVPPLPAPQPEPAADDTPENRAAG